MPKITAPHESALDDLCRVLAETADTLDLDERWPAESLAHCAAGGVYEWFVPPRWGGQGWSSADQLRGYLKLSEACLTTAFILTQFTGACSRLVHSEQAAVTDGWLPRLVRGEAFTTLGISHLTTSRRHLARPALRAEETADGFVLDGYSPWVTGARHADMVVTGATLPDGRHLLLALPTDLPGVVCPPPARLTALTSSDTGPLECRQVRVGRDCLIAGPAADLMSSGGGATGGLQTSALALGLSQAAVHFLQDQAQRRGELETPARQLHAEAQRLRDSLLQLAEGTAGDHTPQTLRTAANSLVLRSTQAALAAAKGTGFVRGHRAGRWCREALFFLVWSCPQPVVAANLCQLAGLAE